jgi:glycosyltransferase involved in cell wall biosynthesis
MKILLLGDYSNVHATLADGLRQLGHTVVVASDGDSWKGYPRDVDLRRKSLGLLDSLVYCLRLWRNFRRFRGFDVVQIINPVFLPLKAERIWKYYAQLRRHNRAVFMGAFGMDHYYVKGCLEGGIFKYSDFMMGDVERRSADNDIWKEDWLFGEKGRLNQFVASDCDGIISGLYEYQACYEKEFSQKLTFIPFPIKEKSDLPSREKCDGNRPIRFFVGIQKARSAYKGTDVMLSALERVKALYPERVEIIKVESVPFDEYQHLMNNSDVILDQLYSYTPAMNALEAMSRGLVVVGGGEPENYAILGEEKLRPIVNVSPNEDAVFQALKELVENPERVSDLSAQSREYIHLHHNHIKVAQQYLEFWNKNRVEVH